MKEGPKADPGAIGREVAVRKPRRESRDGGEKAQGVRQGPKSDPGPTGREMAEPTRVPGRNGGELLRHPPGSNGGTHRGPDLKPRLFVASVLLKAFTDEGELARLPSASKRSGAARRKRERARHAAIHNTAKAVQDIALDAAEGDEAARGQLLRLLALTHETLQPTKAEAAKGGQGPILPKFNRPAQSASPSPPAPIAPPPPERTMLIGPDGEEYVDVPPPEGAR